MSLTCVTATFNVIRAGNRERLVRCVESVAKLKTDHEHLIYDGASTDGTVELLRELQAKTPGLKVVSEPDTGIYNALNKGVRDAQGEWFYVLGCDDYVRHPNVLDAIIASIPPPEKIIATDVYQDNCMGRANRRVNLKETLLSTPYCHQGVLMRTGLIRGEGGFDEKYRIAADYKLLLQCHLKGVCIGYRLGDKYMFACFGMSGLSESNIAEMFHEFDLVVAELFRRKVPLERRDRYYLPPNVLLKLCFHPDAGVGTSAKYVLRLLARRWMRIVLYPLVVITRPLRHRER